MRARFRAALAGVACAAALTVGAAAEAAPESPPATRLAAYCSPSGDVCYGIFRRKGAIFLELTAMARYFSRYTLCVRPPRGAASCRRFPLRGRGRLFGSAVRWHTSFPARGAGRYAVTWRLQAPLGPALAFLLR